MQIPKSSSRYVSFLLPHCLFMSPTFCAQPPNAIRLSKSKSIATGKQKGHLDGVLGSIMLQEQEHLILKERLCTLFQAHPLQSFL